MNWGIWDHKANHGHGGWVREIKEDAWGYRNLMMFATEAEARRVVGVWNHVVRASRYEARNLWLHP
jgi:hypothetical protein